MNDQQLLREYLDEIRAWIAPPKDSRRTKIASPSLSALSLWRNLMESHLFRMDLLMDHGTHVRSAELRFGVFRGG